MGSSLEHILRVLCVEYLNPRLEKIGALPVDHIALLKQYVSERAGSEAIAKTSSNAPAPAPTAQQQQPQQLPGQQQQQPQQKSDGDAVDQQTGFVARVPQQPQRQQQQQAQASSRSWAERAPANDDGKAAASTIRGGGPR